MNARCVDLVISVFCVMFMGSLVSINVYLSSSLSRKQEIKEEVPLLVRLVCDGSRLYTLADINGGVYI